MPDRLGKLRLERERVIVIVDRLAKSAQAQMDIADLITRLSNMSPLLRNASVN